MRLSVDLPTAVSVIPPPVPARRRGDYLIPVAMVALSILAYSNIGARMGSAVALVAAGVSFFLIMYVYYGIARLTYLGRTYLPWISALVAIIVSSVLAGVGSAWMLLTAWGMLLLGGATLGRLTRAGYPQGFIYILGSVIVVLLYTAQAWPIWRDFVAAAPDLSQQLSEEARRLAIGFGYGPEAVDRLVEMVRELFELSVRLFPASTLLAALLQFSVGYLLFTRWVGKVNPAVTPTVPFTRWRVPFGLTPTLVAAIVLRLVGGELLQMVADNLLVILAIYYSLAGLALIEYVLQRFRVSVLMKVFFYLLLVFTQLIGFLAAALLGFIDSFADWRGRQFAKAA